MHPSGFHLQPGVGGEEWPRQSDFARFVAVNTSPSEDYLGLLTPVTFSVLITMAVSH